MRLTNEYERREMKVFFLIDISDARGHHRIKSTVIYVPAVHT